MLGATGPDDVFGPAGRDPATRWAATRTFRRYAFALHPDRAGDSSAYLRLEQLYRDWAAAASASAGSTGPVVVTGRVDSYVVGDLLGRGSVATVYRAAKTGSVLKIARRPSLDRPPGSRADGLSSPGRDAGPERARPRPCYPRLQDVAAIAAPKREIRSQRLRRADRLRHPGRRQGGLSGRPRRPGLGVDVQLGDCCARSPEPTWPAWCTARCSPTTCSSTRNSTGARLAGWSFATEAGRELPALVGSGSYPPEALAGRPVDGKADIHQLHTLMLDLLAPDEHAQITVAGGRLQGNPRRAVRGRAARRIRLRYPPALRSPSIPTIRTTNHRGLKPRRRRTLIMGHGAWATTHFAPPPPSAGRPAPPTSPTARGCPHPSGRPVEADPDPRPARRRPSGRRGTVPNTRTRTPIAVLFDVTGSMGAVPRIMQPKLPQLFGLLQRKGYLDRPADPVRRHRRRRLRPGPAAGRPVRVGQPDGRPARPVFLEGGGGGQKTESLRAGHLLHRPAHRHRTPGTSAAASGYLFLIGDEMNKPGLRAEYIRRVHRRPGRRGRRRRGDLPGGAAAVGHVLRPAPAVRATTTTGRSASTGGRCWASGC